MALMSKPVSPLSRPRPRRLVLTALAVCALATQTRMSAQRAERGQAQPTFRASINLVEVDVTVTDADGRFVRDLTREDFEILEEGLRQEVSTFELIDLPYLARPEGAVGRTPPVEPDVRTNVAAARGRVFILVLDDLHIDAQRSNLARQAARRFVEQHVGPDDVVAVVHTSGRAGAGQEFTPDRTLMLAAIDRLIGRKVKSSTLARLEEYERRHGLRLETEADLRLQYEPDPLDAERGQQAEATVEVLQRLGERLTDTRGHRRSVVLVSQGVDYDVMNVSAQDRTGLSTFTSPSAESVMRRLKLALEALTRANIAVYSVDPRGFATSGSEAIGMSAPPENPHIGLSSTSFDAEIRRANDSLRTISGQTGGVATVSSNDLSAAFDRLMRDNSTYYMLGYYSSDGRADGRFRRIEVRTRRPGLKIRARRGYVAPASPAEGGATDAKTRPADTIRQVLHEALPANGLPLRASLAAFKGPNSAGSVLVTLEVDARTFGFGRKGELYTNRLDAAAIGIDERGKVFESDLQTVNLELKPETYDIVREKGLRFLIRLALRPGRYQVRGAAREAGSGAVGSVHLDLVVPDYREDALSMSGLLLTSSAAAAVPTPRPDVDLGWLPTPPTTARTFTPADTLAAAFALYHNPRRRVGAVDVTTTLVGENGRALVRSTKVASEADLREAPDGYGYVEQVPLSGATPGRYVLRVRASSRTSPDLAITREVPLVVH